MVDMGNVYNFLLYKMSHINAKGTVPVDKIIFINEVILLKFIFVPSSQTNSLLSLKGKSVPN